MKKTILFATAIALTQLLNAQRNNVELGIKGGINAANFKIEPSYNSDSRIGLYIGALAHIHVAEHFSVQPELMLSTQGAEYGNNRKDKFTYLNLPILAQIMFGDGFRLQTGPQFGVLLKAKSKDGNTETDIDKNFNKADFAWSFGTSYLFSSGLGVDVRYNLGLTDISKNNNIDVKNHVWQFGVFYQVRGKK
ncbi:MAG TPA: porin family protein [Flavitalea sp.]|nr:porin family protein [Flavitalea sp.]